MLISIVTIVYNDKFGLEKTIQSVINQTYKNIEYIIIDGNSIDGTIKIIKKYEDKIDYWISEKDNGIYDAMNKGINLSNGDFLIFMNSGDVFYDKYILNNFTERVKFFDKVYFGRALVKSDDIQWIFPGKNININNYNKWLEKDLPNHQAIFFPKIFYEKNRYNLKYKIFADVEYQYRAKNKLGLIFIDITICKFKLGGISSSFSSYARVRQMMTDEWELKKYKGNLYFLKRIFTYNIKYFIKILFRQKFYKVLKMVRKFK